jgi:hypothetical protein
MQVRDLMLESAASLTIVPLRGCSMSAHNAQLPIHSPPLTVAPLHVPHRGRHCTHISTQHSQQQQQQCLSLNVCSCCCSQLPPSPLFHSRSHTVPGIAHISTPRSHQPKDAFQCKGVT